jgi:hypothetical protein
MPIVDMGFEPVVLCVTINCYVKLRWLRVISRLWQPDMKQEAIKY